MKCVCPSGGDRTCPDDCLLAVWHKLPLDDRKARRKPIAEQLYKQGYTMEQIATQLGVTHKTISNDLREFVPKVQIKTARTAGNPKGAGRPKGSGKRRERTHKNDAARQTEAASLFLDEGLSRDKVSEQTGLGLHEVQLAVERERGRRQALEEKTALDPAHLSKTSQEKLDAAIRSHKRKLDLEFDARCREEVKRWLNDVSLPQYAKELEKLEHSISTRKGLMDRVTYKKILSCLHPDRVQDPALKKRYEEAFRLFTEIEKRVLDEKESPTPFRRVPKTVEELMAERAKKTANNRAKWAARKTGSMNKR